MKILQKLHPTNAYDFTELREFYFLHLKESLSVGVGLVMNKPWELIQECLVAHPSSPDPSQERKSSVSRQCFTIQHQRREQSICHNQVTF